MRCTSNRCWFLHALSVHVVLSLVSAPLWLLATPVGILGKIEAAWLTALYPLVKALPPAFVSAAIEGDLLLIALLLVANSLCSAAVLTLLRAIIVKRRYDAMDKAASEA